MPLSSVLGAQSLVRPGVCTSSTRPASPFEGQVIYETDTNRVLVWDNSAWVMIADTDSPPGFQLLYSGTDLLKDSLFTSEYDSYRITFRFTNSSSQLIYLRVRASGSDVTSSIYQDVVQGVQINGTANNILQSSQSAFSIGYAGSSNGLSLVGSFDLHSPFLGEQTILTGQASSPDSTFNRYMILNFASYISGTSSYDGFRFVPNSGTLSGRIRVYGYRNS